MSSPNEVQGPAPSAPPYNLYKDKKTLPSIELLLCKPAGSGIPRVLDAFADVRQRVFESIEEQLAFIAANTRGPEQRALALHSTCPRSFEADDVLQGKSFTQEQRVMLFRISPFCEGIYGKQLNHFKVIILQIAGDFAKICAFANRSSFYYSDVVTQEVEFFSHNIREIEEHCEVGIQLTKLLQKSNQEFTDENLQTAISEFKKALEGLALWEERIELSDEHYVPKEFASLHTKISILVDCLESYDSLLPLLLLPRPFTPPEDVLETYISPRQLETLRYGYVAVEGCFVRIHWIMQNLWGGKICKEGDQVSKRGKKAYQSLVEAVADCERQFKSSDFLARLRRVEALEKEVRKAGNSFPQNVQALASEIKEISKAYDACTTSLNTMCTEIESFEDCNLGSTRRNRIRDDIVGRVQAVVRDNFYLFILHLHNLNDTAGCFWEQQRRGMLATCKYAFAQEYIHVETTSVRNLDHFQVNWNISAAALIVLGDSEKEKRILLSMGKISSNIEEICALYNCAEPSKTAIRMLIIQIGIEVKKIQKEIPDTKIELLERLSVLVTYLDLCISSEVLGRKIYHPYTLISLNPLYHPSGKTVNLNNVDTRLFHANMQIISLHYERDFLKFIDKLPKPTGQGLEDSWNTLAEACLQLKRAHVTATAELKTSNEIKDMYQRVDLLVASQKAFEDELEQSELVKTIKDAVATLRANDPEESKKEEYKSFLSDLDFFLSERRRSVLVPLQPILRWFESKSANEEEKEKRREKVRNRVFPHSSFTPRAPSPPLPPRVVEPPPLPPTGAACLEMDLDKMSPLALFLFCSEVLRVSPVPDATECKGGKDARLNLKRRVFPFLSDFMYLDQDFRPSSFDANFCLYQAALMFEQAMKMLQDSSLATKKLEYAQHESLEDLWASVKDSVPELPESEVQTALQLGSLVKSHRLERVLAKAIEDMQSTLSITSEDHLSEEGVLSRKKVWQNKVLSTVRATMLCTAKMLLSQRDIREKLAQSMVDTHYTDPLFPIQTPSHEFLVPLETPLRELDTLLIPFRTNSLHKDQLIVAPIDGESHGDYRKRKYLLGQTVQALDAVLYDQIEFFLLRPKLSGGRVLGVLRNSTRLLQYVILIKLLSGTHHGEGERHLAFNTVGKNTKRALYHDHELQRPLQMMNIPIPEKYMATLKLFDKFLSRDGRYYRPGTTENVQGILDELLMFDRLCHKQKLDFLEPAELAWMASRTLNAENIFAAREKFIQESILPHVQNLLSFAVELLGKPEAAKPLPSA